MNNLKRIIISFIAAITATIPLLQPVVYADAPMNIVMENVSVPEGTQSVDVAISIPNNPGIALIGFDVSYNTNVMTLTSATSGVIFTGANDCNINRVPFSYTAYTGSANKTASGTLLTLTFSLKPECKAGNYPISISSAEVMNIDEHVIPYTIINGGITVQSDKLAKHLSISNISTINGINFTVNITSDNEVDGVIATALYSSDNELIECHVVPAQRTLSARFNKSGHHFKTFWFNGMGTVRPLSQICENIL